MPIEQFRKDELQEIQGKMTVKIAGRMRVARETLPKLELDPLLLTDCDTKTVVKVTASWKDVDGERVKTSGLGVSIVETEKSHMRRWAVHLAETRARHRALAAAGIGLDLYGTEEFEGDADDRAASHLSSGNGTRPVTPPNPAAPPKSTPAQQAATPAPLSTGRNEIGEKLMGCAKQDKALYQTFLSAIIPGKTSVAQLSDPEVEVCKLVITTAVDVQTVNDINSTIQALAASIKASKPVHQWTADHIKAAYAAVRGETHSQGLPAGHSALNVQPEDCPF